MDENTYKDKIKSLQEEIDILSLENRRLKEDSKKYEDIVRLAPDGILTVDKKGIILTTNPAFLEMSGYDREEILGEVFTSLRIFKKDDLPGFRKIFKDLLNGIVPDPFEMEWIHKDGSKRLSEVRISLMKHNGKLVGIQAITRDVTLRKQVELELQYRFAFEQLISNVATSFLNLPSEKTYDGIVDALKEVCQFAKTENGFVFVFTEDRRRVDKLVEFSCKDKGALRYEIPKMPFQTFVHYIRKLNRNQIIVESQPGDLPKNAKYEWQWVKEHGFRPKVLLPLMNPKGLIGILGFYGRKNTEREWSKDFISLLTFLANLLVIVIERTRTEEALKRSEKNIRNILESSPDAMVVYDLEGKIIDFNEAAYKLQGFEEGNEFAKYSGYDFIIKEEHELATKYIQEAIENGETRNKILHLIRKDQSIFIAEISTKVLYDNEDQPKALISVLKDITSRKSIEEALKLTQYSVDMATDSILWLKSTGKIIYVNKATTEMLHYTKEELLSMYVFDIAPEYPRDKWSDHWQELRQKESFVIQTLHRTKEGKDIPVETAINYFEYAGQEYNFAFTRDISDRKRIEQKLKEAKEKAEEADLLKSAFLANMSHEIRTPMNAILGFSELLLNDDFSTRERKEFVNVITSSSNTLLKLIDDIIDISKIEAGQIKIQKADCEINALLNEIFLSFADQYKNQSIDFKLVKENPDRELLLKTDEFRLRQIIINLLSNAFKFTQEGYIELGYLRHNNDAICFYVKDSGIGISKENQSVIFNRFRQIDDSSTRKTSGTGLGLTISKNLVDLLGGEIWLESEAGKGTTFFFTIPLLNEPLELNFKHEKRASSYDLNNRTILIAEDEESNYKYLAAIIKRYNGVPLWAKDGEEALELFAANKKIQLILLDMRMPGKNGYEVVEEMKKQKSQIPVIAQTAYAMQGEKEKCLEAGCDDYIAKPVDKNILLEKIFSILEEKR